MTSANPAPAGSPARQEDSTDDLLGRVAPRLMASHYRDGILDLEELDLVYLPVPLLLEQGEEGATP